MSTENLVKKLVEKGWKSEDISSWSREQLIAETLAQQGFGESRAAVKLSAVSAPVQPTAQDTSVLIQLLMNQQQAMLKLFQDETRRKEEEMRRREEEERRRQQELLEAADRRQAEMLERLQRISDEKAAKEKEIREREADMLRTERSAREESKASQLKRCGDLLKHVLTKIPNVDSEICIWLDNVQSIFDTYDVPSDLRFALLMPYLNDKAKRLVCKMDSEVKNDFSKFKQALEKEFRLTPAQHKFAFVNASRKSQETFVQYTTRLDTLLRYYTTSRKVTSFDDFVNLMVADKVKDTASDNLRQHLLNLEQGDWFKPDKLAEIADNFVNNGGRSGDAKSSTHAQGVSGERNSRFEASHWRGTSERNWRGENHSQTNFVKPESDRPLSNNFRGRSGYSTGFKHFSNNNSNYNAKPNDFNRSRFRSKSAERGKQPSVNRVGVVMEQLSSDNAATANSTIEGDVLKPLAMRVGFERENKKVRFAEPLVSRDEAVTSDVLQEEFELAPLQQVKILCNGVPMLAVIDSSIQLTCIKSSVLF